MNALGWGCCRSQAVREVGKWNGAMRKGVGVRFGVVSVVCGPVIGPSWMGQDGVLPGEGKHERKTSTGIKVSVSHNTTVRTRVSTHAAPHLSPCHPDMYPAPLSASSSSSLGAGGGAAAAWAAWVAGVEPSVVP